MFLAGIIVIVYGEFNSISSNHPRNVCPSFVGFETTTSLLYSNEIDGITPAPFVSKDIVYVFICHFAYKTIFEAGILDIVYCFSNNASINHPLNE